MCVWVFIFRRLRNNFFEKTFETVKRHLHFEFTGKKNKDLNEKNNLFNPKRRFHNKKNNIAFSNPFTSQFYNKKSNTKTKNNDFFHFFYLLHIKKLALWYSIRHTNPPIRYIFCTCNINRRTIWHCTKSDQSSFRDPAKLKVYLVVWTRIQKNPSGSKGQQ